MAVIQKSIVINATAEDVMARLADAARWEDWYPGIIEMQVVEPFPEKGGKVVFKVKSAGMSIPVTETVLDYQAGKLHHFKLEGMMTGDARWELSPEGDGTRLTTTFDYKLAGGPLGAIADALIVSKLNGGSLEEGQKKLKAILEGAAT